MRIVIFISSFFVLLGCASTHINRKEIILVQPIYPEATKLGVYNGKLKEIKHDIKHYNNNDTCFANVKKIIDSLSRYEYEPAKHKIQRYFKPVNLSLDIFSFIRYVKTRDVNILFSWLLLKDVTLFIGESTVYNKDVEREKVIYLNETINTYNGIVVNKYYNAK